jgi:hypothetical protein
MIDVFRALRRELRGMHIKPSSVFLTLRFDDEGARHQAALEIGNHLNLLRRTPEPVPPPMYAGTILDIPFELVTR